MKAVYAALRVAHLALTVAALPVGLWHWLAVAPDVVARGAGSLVALFVAAVLALFVVALDQADYPVSARGALARTGPLVAHAALAWWSTGGDVAAAAARTFAAYTAALALTLGAIVALTLRSAAATREQRDVAKQVALPLAVIVTVAAVVVTWPLAVSARAATPGALATAPLFAVVAFVAHAALTTSAWLRMTAFSRYLTTDASRARQATFAASWSAAAAIAMLVAVVTSAVTFVLAGAAR